MNSPFSSQPARQFIDGQWTASGPLFESLDPATGEVLGSFHDSPLSAAHDAISAARRAFEETGWASDRELRARVLWQLAEVIESRTGELISAVSLENGKVAGEAGFEISLCAPRLRYYGGLALSDLGNAGLVGPGAMSILVKEPVGVAGVIVPWNAPVFLAIRSIAPALAAGCTVVVKMPAQTALTNSLLADVFASVTDLPSGVVNILTESGDTVARELVASRDVDVISYTGSTAVGAQIMSAAGPLLKRVSLELGGKTPMVVFDDADLDAVVPTLCAAVTTFAGQFCMTGSRILVQRGIAAELRVRLTKAFSAVQAGPASDPASRMGPMIDRGAVSRVDGLLNAVDPSNIIVRGGPVTGPGCFYLPALVAEQDVDSPLIQNEIFGPVATFEEFDGEDDAVVRANATTYGLAASVWTVDGARALRVALALKAGTVWTNTWGRVADQFEEGGYKASGIGRLNGAGGLAEFQEVKHVLQAY